MKIRIIFYCLVALAAYIFLSSLAGSRRAGLFLAQTEITNLAAALNQYHVEFGEFPSGTDAQVLKVLLGENPKNISFLNIDLKRINSKGQFIDPWNTPYQIQIFSKTNFTIRSFGSNHISGDKDDLTFFNP